MSSNTPHSGAQWMPTSDVTIGTGGGGRRGTRGEHGIMQGWRYNICMMSLGKFGQESH